jgi:hypothetical protein
MALRCWQALTIVLVLASASPPPRVTNALIAATHRHGQAEGGKTIQSRARNRIGSTIQVESCRTVAGLSSGRARPERPSRVFDRRLKLPIAIQPSAPSLTPRATLRLRC